jgi:hypothetical protein
MEVEYLETIPDPSMMKKAGQTGYSFSESVSELVDNSIDEIVDGVVLTVDIDIKKDSLEIIDNAGGMNKKELHDAVTLAKASKKSGKLGMYGLGLKTSCVSLGSYFEVVTLKKGESVAYRTWWDEKEWESQNDWLFPMQTLNEIPEKLLKNGHGTIVIVKNLRYKVGNKINQLRGDLGKRFAPFINKKLVEISVNDQRCKALIPEIMEKTKVPIEIKTSYGAITGWAGLLKNSSQRGYYGFDTFRFGRMITCFDKIGFKPHPSVARVVGELHMDYVPVTSNKREWIRTSFEYEEAEKLIKENIKDIIGESRKLASEKRVNVVQKNRLEQYKEGLSIAIDSDELKEYTRPEREVSAPASKNEETKNFDNDKNNSSTKNVDDKVNVEVEKRVKPKKPQKGSVKPSDTGRKRIPKRTHLVKKNQITVKGKKFDYKHEWSHLGEKGPMYEKYYDKEKRKLEVFTNLDFPAVHVSEDQSFYAFYQIVESVAMVMIEEANADWEKYDEIRQILLRESSRYVAELRD